MRVTLAVAAALLAASAVPAAVQDGPRVAIESGELRGAEQDGALVFRGIPYAAPPLGELRWKPPSATRLVRRSAKAGMPGKLRTGPKTA